MGKAGPSIKAEIMTSVRLSMPEVRRRNIMIPFDRGWMINDL